MRREPWFRLVCRRGTRVTGTSEPMSRSAALALFAECLARGDYRPDSAARLAVVSLPDWPDASYRMR